MTENMNVDDARYDKAKTIMLRLLLSALAEDVATREARLLEEGTELLQQDVENVSAVLGVTLRYVAHSMELAFGSAQAAREAVTDELATHLAASESRGASSLST
jgi:hypothetical protein